MIRLPIQVIDDAIINDLISSHLVYEYIVDLSVAPICPALMRPDLIPRFRLHGRYRPQPYAVQPRYKGVPTCIALPVTMIAHNFLVVV
jgi:hypothetical protein